MVAMVSGSGLGLLNSSAGTLGQLGISGGAAVQGANKEAGYLNIFNGNLSLADSDDFLAARGVNVALTRTYNAQGSFNTGNGASWQYGLSRQVVLESGTVNAPSSTVVRTAGDGSTTRYIYDDIKKAYTTKEGGGAYQSITFDAATKLWTWRADRNDVKGTLEIYDGNNSGRLASIRDLVGVRQIFQYNAAGRLSQITDATGGTGIAGDASNTVNDQTYFDYDTAGNLSQIRHRLAGGGTFTRAHYEYDAQNRLRKAIIDLTPDDNSITDGQVYTTTYTYDGDSNRITGVTQSDVTKQPDDTFKQTDVSVQTFGYKPYGNDWKVVSVKDGLGRETTLNYDTAGRTIVTDPLGAVTSYGYDDKGRLTDISAPAPLAGGAPLVTSFVYDDLKGNVSSMKDALGLETVYEYDDNGNRTLERDAAGNTVTRTYNQVTNQLLTESRQSAPGTLMTTRYTYDANSRLQTVISPDGRTTEFIYNTLGELASELHYASGTDKSKLQRIDYTYDARGLRASATRYASTNSIGVGVIDGQSVVRYQYDQAGNLLNVYDGNNNFSQTSYDGLGRKLLQTDALGNTVFNAYDGVSLTIVTTAAGASAPASSTTYVRDLAGQLTKVTQAYGDTRGTTLYAYDAHGRLRATTGPTGQRTYWLYDQAGRQVAQIEHNGALTEFVYDADSQVVRTIRYATSVDPSRLLGAQGQVLNIALTDIRPTDGNPNNRSSWNSYDRAGRLVASVDANGYLTRLVYDGASRLVQTIHRAKPISVGTLDTQGIAASYADEASTDSDRISRTLYDLDGNITGQLDAANYLTEYVYNGAGQLTDTIIYGTVVPEAKRGAGTPATMRVVNAAIDVRQRNLYNGQGQLVGVIDGDNFLTEISYDAAGNVSSRRRYATAVTAPTGMTLATIGKTTHVDDRTTTYTYTALNQLATQTDPLGTFVRYAYDVNGKVVSVMRGAASVDERASAARYDGNGHLIAELNGEGVAKLAAATTPVQVAEIWALYAVHYTYDSNGLRTSMSDAQDNRTLYFYDSTNRLTHTVNGAGEVREQKYDIFGQVVKTIAYGKRVDGATLKTLNGGGNAAITALPLTGGADAASESYYDQAGRLRYTIDGAGQIQERNYNAFNQVYESISYAGKIGAADLSSLTGGYASQANLSSYRSAGTQRTLYYYDADGRMTYTVNPLGEVSGQTYTAAGLVATATQYGVRTSSPAALTGAAGEAALLAGPNAANSVQSYQYNRRGEVTDLSVNGNHTLYTYNGFGESIKVAMLSTANSIAAAPTLDQITQTVYDANGRVRATIDPTGTVTAYQYDSDGRVVDQIRYANALAGYANSANIATTYNNGLAALSDPTRDQHQRFIYDANGNLSVTLTAQRTTRDAQSNVAVKWAVVRQSRDSDGRVTASAAYTLRMDSATLAPSATDVATWLAGADARAVNDPAIINLLPVDGSPVGDAMVRYAYDGAGRLIATATAQRRDGTNILWAVTRQEYDARGNVAKRTAYGSMLSAKTPDDAAILAMPDSVSDAITVYNYDGANRVVATAVAQGKSGPQAVPPSTQHWILTTLDYDNFGNVSRKTQYANVLVTNALPASLGSAAKADVKIDRVTHYRYDSLNRLAVSIDAAGAITRIDYDARGNAVRSIAYYVRTTDPSAVTAAYDPAPTKQDRVTRTVYDLLHRPVYQIDALGQVTERIYDTLGNVTSAIRYAQPLSAVTVAGIAFDALPATAKTAMGLAAPSLTVDRVERYGYDQDGQLRFTVDAAGYLKETVYNALGQVSETRDYLQQSTATQLPLAPTATQMQTEATRQLTAGYASINTFSYDAQGNLIGSTDALGASETYQYDGLRNKTGYTNKAGNTWLYRYDAAGRLVQETSPPVDAYVTGFNLTMGNWGVKTPTALVTLLEYDALGNLLKRIEAAGTQSQRETRYVYDTLGRQTQTIAQNVKIYDDAKDAKVADGSAVRTESDSGERVTTVTYNVFGEAVANRDVLGRVSFKVYDLRGQVAYDVDALGYVTAYGRDNFGNVTTLTRYATLPNPRGDGLSPAQVGAKQFAVQINANAALDRTISTEFDLLGRVTKVSEPVTGVFDTRAAASPYLSAGKTTETFYTTFGDTKRKSVYGADLNGARVTDAMDSRYYYDARGNMVSEVALLTTDSGGASGTGYATVYLYGFDTAAKATTVTKTEYNNSYTWDDTKPNGGTPTANIELDRVTRSAYDKAGRLLSTTQVNASVFEAGVQTKRNLVTSYGYDVVGNKVSVTDALGGVSYTYYDKLGRTIAVAKSQATVPAGITAAGSPLTAFKLDILGNVLLRIDYAKGASGTVNALGATPADEADADNRVTATRYDIDGHAIEVLDAEQFGKANPSLINTSYDIYGRVAKQWRTVTTGHADASTTTQTAYQINRYDQLGRLVEVLTPPLADLVNSTAAAIVHKINIYNVFGELTGTAVAYGSDETAKLNRQEVSYTRYDQAGRAWLTNAGDGVDRLTLYDAMGQATAQVTGTGTGADQHALQGLATASDVKNMQQVLRSETRYDLLGHVIDNRQLGDPRLQVLQQINGTWVKVVLASGQAGDTNLIVIGDEQDTGSQVIVKYGLKGGALVDAPAARIQWIDGNLVFSTNGLAEGEYEYKVYVTPPNEETFVRDAGSLRVTAGVDKTREAHVLQLFRMLFKRAPDVDSLNFWINAYNSGRPDALIVQDMLLSTEATTAGLVLNADGSNAVSIITAIFKDVFGLTDLDARQAEINQWAQRYKATSPTTKDNRGQALADLLYATMAFNGPAAANMLKTTGADAAALSAQRNRTEIIRIYITLFGRAPESTGVTFWLNAMAEGMTAVAVANSILESKEARQPWLYPVDGLTPAQYDQQLISHIYSAMLGRSPTAAELTNMLTLKGGMSAGALVVNIGEWIGSKNPSASQGAADKALFSNKVALAYAAAIDGTAAGYDADAGAALLAGVTSAATAKEAADKALLALKAAAAAAKPTTTAAAIAANTLPLEERQRVIARLYAVLFSRAPDQNGLTAFMARSEFAAGEWADITQLFLNSTEAQRLLGNWSTLSDGDFVAKLYSNALGELPTSDAALQEMKNFTAQLASGKSRAQVAFNVATGMLGQAAPDEYLLSDADKALQTLLSNRASVGLTVALSLGNNDEAQLRATLSLVTATDIKAALQYSYDSVQNTLLARMNTTQGAAATAATVAENISKAAVAAAAAAAASTALATRPSAVARLQLMQLYVGLLGRTEDTFAKQPDLPAINDYVTNIAKTPIAAVAQNFINSPEGQAIYQGLSNKDFVARVYQKVLDSSSIVPPPTELDFWVQQLNAVPAPTRGAVALSIINSFATYVDAGPDANATAYLNAKFAFNGRVAAAFTKVEQATVTEAARVTQLQADLKAAAASLTTALDQAKTAMDNANSAKTTAMNAADSALTTAYAAGDGKGYARVQIVRLYASVLQRQPGVDTPPLKDVDFYLNSDAYAKLPQAQFLEQTAQQFITSPEGRKIYPAASYTGTEAGNLAFITKLYSTVLGRVPGSGDNLNFYLDIMRGDTAPNLLGRIALMFVNAQSKYADGTLEQLAYKSNFDIKVGTILASLNAEAGVALTSANTLNAKAQSLAKAVTTAQTVKNQRDAAVTATAKNIADANIILTAANLRDVVELYAAVRKDYDMAGVAFQSNALRNGTTTLNGNSGSILNDLLSNEYPADPTAFVKKLYLMVLNRSAPLDSEVQFHVNEMANGHPRVEIARNFITAAHRDLEPSFSALINNLVALVRNEATNALDDMPAATEAAQKAAQDLQTAKDNYAALGYTTATASAAVTAAQGAANSYASLILANEQIKLANPTVVTATDLTGKYNAKKIESDKANADQAAQQLVLAALNTAVADVTPMKAVLKARTDIAAAAGAAASAYGSNPMVALAQQITELYSSVLNHTPTLAQLQYQLDRLANGAKMVDVANDLMNGFEARSKNLYPATMTNGAFITQLYSYGLGRGFSGDPTGLAFWVKFLTDGNSRAAVAVMFIGAINHSGNNDSKVLNDKAVAALKALSQATAGKTDYDAYIVTANDANRAASAVAGSATAAALAASPDANALVQIARLYQVIFNRAPEPSGMRFWLAALHSNPTGAATVAQSMVAQSDEGQQLFASLSNADFVTRIFAKGLGRPPLAAELSKYSAQLPAQTRGQVVLNIISDVMAAGTGNDLVALSTRTGLMNKVETVLNAYALSTVKYEASLQAAQVEAADAISKGVVPRERQADIVVAISNTTAGVRGVTQPNVFTVDRWGNVLTVLDRRDPNWKISYAYNYNNQQIDQTLNALASTGAAHASTSYDALGRVVKTTDYRGYATLEAYDSNGNVLEETYADGGHVSNTYDLFGNRLTVKRWDTDATGVQTRYAYDHLGHLLSTKIENKVNVDVGVSIPHSDIKVITTQAQNLSQQFFYDELGRRVKSVDAAGMSTYSQYDLDGNVIATWINQNLQRTVTAYDAFHHRTATLDANGRTMSWKVNSFGRIEQFTDMGKAVTTYDYDAAGYARLTSISRGGVNSTIAQTYENGLLVRIVNSESGLTTNYSYDVVGNRLTEQQSYAPGAAGALGAPARVQNNKLFYDKQNRLTSVRDDQYQLTYTYDNNGNRTSIATVYGGEPKFTKFNGYDQVNRQIAVNVDAWNDATKVAVLGKTGHQITYDLAGNRKTDSYIGTAINASNLTTTKDAKTTESYSYDAVGRLQYTYRDGVLFDTRTYDAAGRLTRSGMVDQASDKSREATFAAGIISQKRTYAYNETGQMLRQQETNWDGPDQDVIFFSDDQTTGGYDKMGNVLSYTVTREHTDQSQHGIYTIEYLWTDGAREKSVKLALNNTTTISVYDNAGNRIKLLDQTGAVKTQFWYDADGHVQSKLETEGNVSSFSLIVNGQMLGDENFKNTNILGSSYQPVTSAALTAAPSTYSVQRETETLQGIAQGIWGDAKLWYLIADANGLSSDSVLKVGDVLRIPTRVNTVHNDYATFKPYDASEAIGNTAPALPPPVQSGGGCGGVGMLIMIVVAVVVTIYTAGAMAGESFAFMSAMSTGASAMAGGVASFGVAGGALAAAAGSVASQLVGMSIGAQDSFNWKGVAMSAIGGGVGVGVGAYANGLSNTALLGTTANSGTLTFSQIAARAAVSSTISQGVGMAAGLQNGFSWANVAASYASAYVGAAVAQPLSAPDGLFASVFGNAKELAVRTVSGFAAGASASILRGGKIDVAQIATDAFGNALGESLARSSSGTPDLSDDEWASIKQEVMAGDRYASTATDPRRNSVGIDRVIFGSHSTNDAATADEVARQLTLQDDAARISQLEKNISMLVDVTNMQRVDAASQAGLDLRPTIENAARLGLLNSEGSQVTVPDTGLVGLGFGTSAVQGSPQWVDAVGDSRIRLDYYNTNLDAIPPKYRLGLDATIGELLPNAQAASAERNVVLDETRARISNQGLEWSRELKAQGKSFDWLENSYSKKVGEEGNPGAKTYREIIEASGRSNPTVTNIAKNMVRMENGLNIAAKPLAVLGAGMDGYSLGTQINQSLNTGNWQNTANEAARIGGGWTGAWAFGQAGASGGAIAGAWTGPFAPIAVPAFTLIGGLGGGLVGYWLGGKAGQNTYNYANGSR